MRVTVIGTGYVGIVTGATLAYLGHQVTCVDSDAAKVAGFRAGKLPLYEPHLGTLLALCGGSIEYATDLASAASADVIFICVGTPSSADGSADLSAVEAAARGIGHELLRAERDWPAIPEYVVVNKSTVPVGTGAKVDGWIREHSGNASVHVVSNPEFLREGCAIADALYPDRIVVGSETQTGHSRMRALYEPLVKREFAPFVRVVDWFGPEPLSTPPPVYFETSRASAELIKYASNAFLATKISFVNEIAAVAEHTGADIAEVARGMGLDSRIGPKFLNAGIGWGGSCFAKDVAALRHTAAGVLGSEPPLLAATAFVNRTQRFALVDKLMARYGELSGLTVALLGLAFKPGTDDLRDAPALDIARCLIGSGAAVRAFDPAAMERCAAENRTLPIVYCASAAEAVRGADAVLLVTEWEEFLGLDLSALAASMRHAVLLDGRNLYSPAAARAAGFEYHSIGRR